MLYEEISNDDNELNKALSLNNNELLYEAISDDDNEPNPALSPNDNDLCVNDHSMVDDDKNNDQSDSVNIHPTKIKVNELSLKSDCHTRYLTDFLRQVQQGQWQQPEQPGSEQQRQSSSTRV
ncbi:unnamed protein product [Rotaria sordida]|uniref:Uncharacterized protein n=2 Tax=Rotaria sordida TaxID=392033 RepID=A0A814ED23_9BILA|nr:unnamed protein product [Rotaria sordida]CAF3521859.1 unnamed protein product [Rotaria sordida]CAF4136601.1 unnamed protein product [Rotaria sordida]